MEMNRRATALAMGAITTAIAVGACHITLVSTYDDTFDQELTATQKDVGALFSKIIDNVDSKGPIGAPPRTLERAVDDTAEIAKVKADIATLEVRAAAHVPDVSDTKGVADLKKTFTDFVAEYATPVDSTFYTIQNMSSKERTLNQELSVLMAQELLRKQGQTTTGAGK